MSDSIIQISDSIIQIKDVNKWFGDFQVLKDINLEVKPKEKIVVCGPSGSGKSTLIRCINRLEEHQKGNIIVDGTEISVPSTTMLPSWCSSNLLMHLIKVDLPDPDGPQTTIFSLGLTSRFISFNT